MSIQQCNTHTRKKVTNANQEARKEELQCKPSTNQELRMIHAQLVVLLLASKGGELVTVCTSAEVHKIKHEVLAEPPPPDPHLQVGKCCYQRTCKRQKLGVVLLAQLCN